MGSNSQLTDYVSDAALCHPYQLLYHSKHYLTSYQLLYHSKHYLTSYQLPYVFYSLFDVYVCLCLVGEQHVNIQEPQPTEVQGVNSYINNSMKQLPENMNKIWKMRQVYPHCFYVLEPYTIGY